MILLESVGTYLDTNNGMTYPAYIDNKPDMDILLSGEYKKAKLRAHSDYMWNNAVNDWALSFLAHADIMVESKAKNLASVELHKYYTENNNELSKQNVRQKADSDRPTFAPLW